MQIIGIQRLKPLQLKRHMGSVLIRDRYGWPLHRLMTGQMYLKSVSSGRQILNQQVLMPMLV